MRPCRCRSARDRWLCWCTASCRSPLQQQRQQAGTREPGHCYIKKGSGVACCALRHAGILPPKAGRQQP